MTQTNFVEYAEDSDFHGIRQVTRRQNGWVRRILWLLLLLTSVGVLVSNTTMQIIDYFKFEHVTKYDIDYTNILDFPALTICNVNKHKRSSLTKADIAIMGPHLGFTDENINLKHPELYPQQWYNDTFLGTDWNSIIAANPAANYDLTDFYNRTGHQFTDLVQHCEWKGALCDSTSWKTDFTHYGKCYTFNSQGDHHLIKAGSGNGLYLVLYVEDDEYLETNDAEDLGIKFLAHDPSEPPYLKELGFGAAPGYHYLMAIRQQEIVALPYPYGTCEREHSTTYYSNYSIPACRIECETKTIYDACGCKPVESPGDYSVCTPDQFDCAEAKLVEIEKSDACACQSPCHTVEYPFKMSFLQTRSTTVDKLRNEHAVPAHLNEKNLVILNVYFDVLASEKIEQTPAYEILDILSDFGGNMGLWLGASILAAAQLIDYLVQACCKCCRKKNRVEEPERGIKS